ncbi:glycosyltransferase [Ruegeria sp. EL01]|uniref:glycosyltransferase n=1 Tax=Ruegeria sp. EL01 TaxID=2107578 RepID=UPI0021100049|nr:glycosyltransferase [Ruegeria sp. EL01]
MRPRRIVELGTHFGYSYFAMCEAVQDGGLKTDCFAVDAWKGDENSGLYDESVYQSVVTENQKYGHFSHVLRKTFSDARNDIEDGSVDLLHVDGRHFYEDVKEDFESWIPKLSSSAVVLFHDTEVRERNFGIHQYWAEVKDKRPSFNFQHCHGLGVLFWGQEISEGLRDLVNLATASDGIDTVLTLFSAFGGQMSDKQMCQELETQLLAERKIVVEKKDLISSLDSQISEFDQKIEALAEERLQHLREENEFELDYVLRLVNDRGWLLKRGLKLMKHFPRDLSRKIRGKKPLRKPAALSELDKELFSRNEGDQANSITSLLQSTVFGKHPEHTHLTRMSPKILIVAELSIPQCTKYRVTQKANALESLGYDVNIMEWQDNKGVLIALQTHTLVIFYRVPGVPEVVEQFHEAARLNIPRGYDIDDLIFDVENYKLNPNLREFSDADLKNLMNGAQLYRQALMLADFNIGSTSRLCAKMADTNGAPSFILENALDAETLEIAQSISSTKRGDSVTIVYGSGTNTHNADFDVASDAILQIMQEYHNVRLHIVGELTLPSGFDALESRIKFTGRLDYSEYLRMLADDDISIAPLVDVEFNHAKSNIKFLEAAAVGLPSVCSSVAAFSTAIEHGQTGFLAASRQEWYDGLKTLIEDAELRAQVGEAARKSVVTHYSPDAIRDRQLLPITREYIAEPHRNNTHVMMVNVFYAPQSFGGATLLVEDLVESLKARHDVDISIFTTGPGRAADSILVRRQANGDPVFRFSCQSDADWAKNAPKEVLDHFADVLRATRPDVVHFHSIQGLGSELAAVCDKLDIPYCITLHDAWWLCARQFLVTKEGNYCGQTVLDHEVCQRCVGSTIDIKKRNRRLEPALEGAQKLIAPSKYWANFHIDNGLPERSVMHCENGIEIPVKTAPNAAGQTVRFGFVAGMEVVKGFPLLQEAFNALDRNDWSLTLVDHARKVFGSRIDSASVGIKGEILVVPPFSAANRDEFFDRVDVLLFPSQWPESFGLTVREALVRNKWVIATDLGGQAEAITPGINGTLIPLDGGAKALAKAIEDILDRKSDLAGWINPNSDKIRSVDEQAAELAELFSEIKKAR